MLIWNNFIYHIAILILVSGLYLIITNGNLMRKIIGLGIFQNAFLVFYIAFAKLAGGTAPIMDCVEYENCITKFASPLPHVLMLTAIVVGFATLSVGLALIMRIKEEFGTIEEDKIHQMELDCE